MLIQCFVLAVLALGPNVDGAMMNMSCPVVTPRELDWKAVSSVDFSFGIFWMATLIVHTDPETSNKVNK